jgi:hypothetical protein
MKTEEQKKIDELNSKVQAFVKEQLGIDDLSNWQYGGLLLELADSRDDKSEVIDLTFDFASLRCPRGFKKVVRINNTTGEQYVECVPI